MFKKNNKLFLYALIFALPFLFLFLKPAFFWPLKLNVVKTISWSREVILFPFREIKKILTYHGTYANYLRLKDENEILKHKIMRQEEFLQGNKLYQELLDYKWRLTSSAAVANVIGRDLSNWSTSILVDRGTKNGIKEGMPVINTVGVIGKISEVGSNSSRVMLVNDPNFNVAAIVKRSRESGLLSGTLQGICRMRYLSIGADIKEGDQIITSRVSASFPDGLLIGEVISVRENQDEQMMDCLVKPFVSLSRIEQVLIVQNQD